MRALLYVGLAFFAAHKGHFKHNRCLSHTRKCWHVNRNWWRRHHPRVREAGRIFFESASWTTASWYDDAESTACGTHYAIGVAKQYLTCGTRLRICNGG